MEKKVCLIHALAYSRKGLPELKDALSAVKPLLEIDRASSVYTISGEYQDLDNIHNLREVGSYVGLSICLRALTPLSPHQVLDGFRSKIEQLTSQVTKQAIELSLLLYEGETLMTPELTLPHPDLSTRPEILIPAAELWGDYHHPILNQPLSTLAKKFSGVPWGEFYCQSKSVLDF